mmetsp:Transcript_4035/g.6818  ORF Transcript_4035/g.6818 Transcript_4035/m.6818 type:complete len:151 (+) Transcript_4035:241-693(+)
MEFSVDRGAPREGRARALEETTETIDDFGGLCPPESVHDNNCYITNRTVKFTRRQSFIFTFDGVFLENSQIFCKDDGERACELYFSFREQERQTKLQLEKGSSINAKVVVISSESTELLIDGKSMIETDGRSTSVKGSDPNKAQGGSYIG